MSKAGSRSSKQILRDIWTLISSAQDKKLFIQNILESTKVTYSQFKQCLVYIATRNTEHIKRRVSDIWVNNYNEHLSRAWNANLDIQFVIDSYACVAYILSYISKSETEMGDLLQNATEKAQEGNTDALSAMKIIGKINLTQVAVYRVCSFHLKKCTRDVVFIPAGSTCNIYKTSLPISVIKSRSRKGDGNDENIWMVSIHEKYYARPNLSIFNDIFLAEFASKFFILPNSQHPKSSELSPVYQLQNK